MQQKGYKMKNVVINTQKAKYLALLVMLPFMALTFWLYNNVNSFKQENSVLRSIGLTQKQLCKMNICEGLCYAFFATLARWDDMIQYAKSLGVPDEQCDFLPEDFTKQEY